MDREESALGVWYAARVASGGEPDERRVARVREKLADPAARLVLVERGSETLGMALAEPFREAQGTGDVRADWGHISMVFVHPDHQRLGIGSKLVQRLTGDGPWPHLSVWTRESNARAQGLYRSCGFVATGEFGAVGNGERTQRWERRGPR